MPSLKDRHRLTISANWCEHFVLPTEDNEGLGYIVTFSYEVWLKEEVLKMGRWIETI